MATRKRLGSHDSAAATPAVVYNTPTGIADAVVSSIVVCNRGATATTFRISVKPEIDATADDDYLFYDAPIEAKETVVIQAGLTLEPDWDICVEAGAADVTFTVWGQEN